MESISIGQVILASFPFSDLTSRKYRPCLVIGLAEFDDIIVCQITSRHYTSKRAITLTKKDFQSGSIIVNSFIRPDKIATLDKKTATRILGTLNSTKLKKVKTVLKRVLEIT